MARNTFELELPQGSLGHYRNLGQGWNGAFLTTTDLPDGKQLVEVYGALRDTIGGKGNGDVIGLIPEGLRPSTNQVGSRAVVDVYGNVKASGAFDSGNTISFRVAYTRG